MIAVVMTSSIDLSLIRYVAGRKGESAARLRQAAAYAYGGDLKVRMALDQVRPVTLAMEATVRFWQTVGKNRLLGNAVRVGERQFPRLYALLQGCADVLQIPVPALYITPELGYLNAHTFGATDDATIVLGGALVDHLTDEQLTFVLGHECGHIQNNHMVYLTTLHYLTTAANLFVRWITQPAALALNAWSRRAEITCDRAGLLCTRDLSAAEEALVKTAVGSRRLYGDINVDEYLQQLGQGQAGPGRIAELLSTHPYLPKRVKALRLFADTSFFRAVRGEPPGQGGTKDACDADVAALLGVL